MMQQKIRSHWFGQATATLLFFLGGCSLSQYAEQADKTAYRTMEATSKTVLGEKSDVVSVDYEPAYHRKNNTIVLGKKTIPLYAAKPTELFLDDILRIALASSRDYQDRKETLYVQALALANERRGWDLPQLAGNLDANGEWEVPGGSSRSADTPVAASAELSFTQRLIHGGALTVGAALDMATDLLGSETLSVGSLIDANFTQPLLRGGWKAFAYEEVYRLQRDFEFSVYDFRRYQQTFLVDILTRYYSVLQLRDRLENEKANIERLRQTRNLTKVLADGGQVSRIELDQADQNLLNAKIRLTREQQNYQNSVDALKILVGLPVLANVEPAYPEALEKLRQFKPSKKDIPFTEEKAVTMALAARPDVLTRRAAVRDADRNVEITADEFLPQLDLEMGYSATGYKNRDAHKIGFHRHRRFARLVFNYQIDQTDNRDAYRNVILAKFRAERDYELFVDEVRQEVRQTYRQLQRSRETYELQVKSVAIAKRRRALAAQQQKEGQASARDVLEAEEDLRNAQNGLTDALVTYTTTRLQFLASLGMLQAKDKGTLHERKHPETFERLQKRYPYTTGKFNANADKTRKLNP